MTKIPPVPTASAGLVEPVPVAARRTTTGAVVASVATLVVGLLVIPLDLIGGFFFWLAVGFATHDPSPGAADVDFTNAEISVLTTAVVIFLFAVLTVIGSVTASVNANTLRRNGGSGRAADAAHRRAWMVWWVAGIGPLLAVFLTLTIGSLVTWAVFEVPA